MLRTNVLKRWWVTFFLLASLIYIGRYFYSQSDKLSAPLHLSLPILAIAVVLHLIYWHLNVGCWRQVVLSCTHKHIGYFQGFSHLATITLGKYFPGKIWGMVARASLLKQQGVELHQSAYATLQEQFLLLHAATIVSAALLWAIGPSILTAVLLILAGLSIVMVVPLQKTAFRLMTRVSKGSWRHKLLETNPLRFRQIASLLLGYSMIWVTIGLVFCCICFALFPVEPSVRFFMRLILANTVGVTLGFFAIFSPGGLGVREAVTSALLVSQLPLEDALLLGLVFRLWVVISELLNGIALLIPGQNTPSGRQP